MSEIIFGLLAIFLQGIFSGSETAFTRANWIRLATWQKKHTTTSLLRQRAESAIYLLRQKEKVLIITLIFTNLFVVSASAIFSRFFIIHFGAAYISIAVVTVFVLSLIFGDFLPKAMAQAFPEYWVIISSPLIALLVMIMNFFHSKNKIVKPHQLSRPEFLSLLQEQKSNTSLITNQMAKALFDFSRISVGEIMVPKERVVAFRENLDLKIIKKTIEKYRFSRYPVYQKDNHKIIGIVHIKDILTAMRKKRFQVNEIIRTPYRVYGQAKAMPVLKAMSRQGEHIAIVHDENYVTIGIITLEDLLEELVGEIRSET